MSGAPRRSRRKVKATQPPDADVPSPVKRPRRAAPRRVSEDDDDDEAAEPAAAAPAPAAKRRAKPKKKAPPRRSKPRSRRGRQSAAAGSGAVAGSRKHSMKASVRHTASLAPRASFPGIPVSAHGLRQSAGTLARAVSSQLRQFTNAEFCYSSIDRGYFLRNEFEECLAEMRIPAVNKLCRAEWAAIRTVMGRPRRLSTTFLREERAKLDRYRRDVRLVQRGKAPAHSLQDSPFVYQVPVPLRVGQHVSALHPQSRSLAMGCVLTRDLARGIYRVQFDRVELGVHRCMDTDIMPHGPVQLLYPALASHSTSGSPVGFTPHDSWRLDLADVEVEEAAPVAAEGGAQAASMARTNQLRIMGQVQQLLDRKEALLQHLKTMNVEARGMNGVYSDSFRRGYTWLLMCLEATNRALDPVLQSMRRLRNLQGVSSGPDVAEKLRMLLSRCDEKATAIVRKQTSSSSTSTGAAEPPEIESGSALQLITSALSFLLAVKSCSEHSLASWETWALLERGLNNLKPKFKGNSGLFKQLEDSVASLRASWAN